jgi:NAD(P) transhydrogenase
VKAQLKRNSVTTINGMARFVDPHTIEIDGTDGPSVVTAHSILIACGTRPAESPMVITMASASSTPISCYTYR